MACVGCVAFYIAQIHNCSLDFCKTVFSTWWNAGWTSPFNFVQRLLFFFFGAYFMWNFASLATFTILNLGIPQS